MAKPNQKREELKVVEISCSTSNAREVFVAGTFNNWHPNLTPMESKGGGVWSTTLRLKPGTYEYKFLIDGEWSCKPGLHEFDPSLSELPDCVHNVYGTMNRKLEVD